MYPPVQFTTVFTQRLENRAATSPIWLVLGIIISLVVVVIGIVLAAPFLLIVIPLAIIINYRIAQSQKPKHVGFFLETGFNNDIYYGYIDHKGARHGHQLIDEYTYWYYTDGMTMSGTKCVFVVMLKSKAGEIFLKEELMLQREPEGWGNEQQKISESAGVYHMNNVSQLTTILDQLSFGTVTATDTGSDNTKQVDTL